LIASKYRFLFLESESPLSIEKFRAERDPATLRHKVQRLLRETTLIEEESHAFELDSAEALIVIAGADAHLGEIGIDMGNYSKSRAAMELAAQAIIATPPDSTNFERVRTEWTTALDVFLDASGRINAVYATRALNNLAKHFHADDARISPPEGQQSEPGGGMRSMT